MLQPENIFYLYNTKLVLGSMPFEKGHSKKGGREKGVANKTTEESRAAFAAIMQGEIQHVQKSLMKLRTTDPKAYLDSLAKLFPYFIPKMVEHSGELPTGDIIVNIE